MATAHERFRGFAAKSVKKIALRLKTIRMMQKLRADFILTFHLVPPEDRAAFEEVVHFLAQNFRLVSMDELVTRSQSQMTDRREAVVALTFDDGLKNHAAVAYEVLARTRVPATYYVCAEMVGRPNSIWTWETHCRLERLSKPLQSRFFEIAGVSGELQSIVNWMKTIPISRREEIEGEIRKHTSGFEFTSSERDRFELMNWEQLRNLDPGLITIGSHTANHVDLPQVDAERLDQELLLGKTILEKELNRPVKHFSYPNGNLTKSVLPAVQKYYSSAVTTRWGAIKVGDNPFLLNRINAQFNLTDLSWELCSASLSRANLSRRYACATQEG